MMSTGGRPAKEAKKSPRAAAPYRFLPPGMEEGTPRQRDAARALCELRLGELLRPYSPRLVGTVPIGIDGAASDLDVICEAADLPAWCEYVERAFGRREGFRCSGPTGAAATANFWYRGWEIELYGENRPTDEQNGYRHMVVEERILRLLPEAGREQVRRWKAQGLKTEPAFAKLLALPGDPYEALLALREDSDGELKRRIREAGVRSGT